MLIPPKARDFLFYAAIALALAIALIAGYAMGAASNFENAYEHVAALLLIGRQLIYCIGWAFHHFANDVIAAFTVILGIGTVCLAVSTRRLASDAANTAVRELRAYVYFENPTTGPWPPVTPTHTIVLVNITNGGATWANKFTSQVAIAKLAASDSRDPFDTIQWTEAPAESVLGPQQTINVHVGNITPQEQADVLAGKLRIFAVGVIKYNDTLNAGILASHTTEMCRVFGANVDGSTTFAFHSAHNRAN